MSQLPRQSCDNEWTNTSNYRCDPPGMSAIAYHAECLSTIEWGGGSNGRVPEKVIYHLRMLGHVLDGSETRFLPLVTVIAIVPQADEVRRERAIQSCIAQTYEHVEIIVVETGDGLQPRTDPTISRRIKRVRLTRSGGASAWNLGLTDADGDFVHFLDAGNVLQPDAIRNKVRAFVDVCDARACYAGPLGDGLSSGPLQPEIDDEAIDSSELAFVDPVLASVFGYSLDVSAVLLPRWLVVQIGQWESEFAAAAESRFWLRLARAGFKAVGLPEPCMRRLDRPVANQQQRLDECRDRLQADHQSLDELGREPTSYRYIIPLSGRITETLERADTLGMQSEELDSHFERILEFESAVGQGIPSAEGLTAVLLDQLLFSVRQRRREAVRPALPIRRWLDVRQMQLMRRIGAVHHVNAVDLRRWLPTLPGRPYDDLTNVERSSLLFGLQQLQVSALVGELPIQMRSLVRLGACFSGHPYESQWNGIARLARVVGNDTAKYLCRQSFFYYGWRFLGHAKQLLTPQQEAA